jgi:hypothetical protein
MRRSNFRRVAYNDSIDNETSENPAARCEEWALRAAVGPERAFYEGLAHYYSELATNFREVIEKQSPSN